MRTLLVFCMTCSLACDLPYAPGVNDTGEELDRRRGRLAAATETLISEDALVRIRDVQLTSTTGLQLLARVRVPLNAGPASRLPGVVVIGGRDTGRDAVRHVAPDAPAVIIAPEYPDVLKTQGTSELVERIYDIRAAALDLAAGLQLLAEYLTTRPEVDPGSIVLIGVSYGGFFAPMAAASDNRFSNIALLYSAGDLQTVLQQNMDENLPTASRQLGAELAVLPLQRLEPLRYVASLAPRPLLIVNGLYDDRIPRRSAEALMNKAREPKEIVWLPTGHLEPSDTALIRELVDTAFARLPILARTRR